MAEAALDYDYFEPDESLEIPEGGIADFLTAKTGTWADDDVPSSGIARVKHVVDQLAEYGRFDDEYMVHAAPNETVVPFPVLDANPKLRLALYAQMRAMGLEPERYTVGNELNSINPVTGQREFGILKKIKKFFKKVVKVVKKIAPIVLPIVLSLYPPLGMIYGSMLGSGLGTLIQGGSFKDALKSAAISGATAGIMKGMKGGIEGLRSTTSTFGEGARTALREGFRPVATQRAAAALASAAAPTPVDPAKGMWPGPEDMVETLTEAPVGPGGISIAENAQIDAAIASQQGGAPQQFTARTVGATQPFPELPGTPTPVAAAEVTPFGQPPAEGFTPRTGASFGLEAPSGTPAATAAERLAELKAPSFREGIKGAFTKDETGFLEGLGQAFFPQKPSVEAVLAAQGKTGTKEYMDILMAQKIAKDQGPGMMRRLLPIFGASMAAAKIAEGREEGAPEPLFDPDVTGQTLLDEDPDKFMLNYRMPPPITIQQWEGTGTGAQPTIQWAPPGGAGGGNVDSYPPRIGGINGPGSGTSDDVPAMLSDGEFVFTAKAVKGAGNGSRKSGTSNLYSLMRNFEGRA